MRLPDALRAEQPDRTWWLEVDGRRLHVEEHGDPDSPPVVYLNGLLLSARLNRTLAGALAARGQRVVLLDLLGHGRSDKPPRAHHYRFDTYPAQVVALLDALDSDDVVLGGVSLGAQVALWAGVQHPDRLRGLVLEMPVGENGTPFADLLFIPVMLTARYAPLPFLVASAVARRLPSTGTWLDGTVDAASQAPEVVSSVLHGLLVGPMMPTREARAALDVPALVLTHPGDPLHPEADAVALARLLPRGRLVRGSNALDLRLHPDRLASTIVEFAEAARSEPPAVRLRQAPPR